jgi:general secretion pathway protein A
LRKLAHEAPVTIKFVVSYSANLDFDNLLTVICDQLQLITHALEHTSKLKALKEYLNTCFKQGINVALLIDEAHHLGKDVLSSLLTLTPVELQEEPILQIVLSGVPALEEILVQQQALHPNIANAVHVHLEPLSKADVTAFIYRQLQSAGGPPPENLLPAPVIDGIARYTWGIPRLINTLCERALWLAQLNGQSTVSTEIIDKAASELMLQEQVTVQEPESQLSYLETPYPGNTQPLCKAARPEVHHERLIEEATFTRQTLVTRAVEHLSVVALLEQPNPRRGRFYLKR